MHVRVTAGHHVEIECATLHTRVSSKDTAVIHLLRLWPGRSHDVASRCSSADARASQGSAPSLTPREREVLELLAAGKSTRAMVEELGVSPATVRTHVENTLRKLRVHSRLEAVAVALREDLIRPPGAIGPRKFRHFADKNPPDGGSSFPKCAC
jgi:DNA-binding CsgD family transcriptional regulator